MKKVQVLLSTYNGERYLAEQLDSIINQSFKNIGILIRDDGSSDSTLRIINQYVKKYPDQIEVLYGENVGVIKSFFLLLAQSDDEADYYCYCDQDDVWFHNKIERAVQYLQNKNDQSPNMYFTNTTLTDMQLNPLKNWPSRPRKKPSFYNALIQNIAVGMTITINKKARDLLVKKEVEIHNIIMHDWWTYLCVSAFGKVYYDDSPSAYYRQHGNNVVGGESTLIERIKKKWSSFNKHKGERLLYKQAVEFNRLFGEELKGQKKEQLKLFLFPRHNMKNKIKFLYKSKLYRQNVEEQVLFKFLILIGYV